VAVFGHAALRYVMETAGAVHRQRREQVTSARQTEWQRAPQPPPQVTRRPMPGAPLTAGTAHTCAPPNTLQHWIQGLACIHKPSESTAQPASGASAILNVPESFPQDPNARCRYSAAAAVAPTSHRMREAQSAQCQAPSGTSSSGGFRHLQNFMLSVTTSFTMRLPLAGNEVGMSTARSTI